MQHPTTLPRDQLEQAYLRLEAELTKWQKPFNQEQFDSVKKQASRGDSLAAQAIYITALEHALKHMNEENDKLKAELKTITPDHKAYWESVVEDGGKRIKLLIKENTQLKAEKEEREKQEPMLVFGDEAVDVLGHTWFNGHRVDKGTKLYAHPPAPEGKALVPVEPLMALQYQTQCDEDGTLIAVSRQAVDELLKAAKQGEGYGQ